MGTMTDEQARHFLRVCEDVCGWDPDVAGELALRMISKGMTLDDVGNLRGFIAVSRKNLAMNNRRNAVRRQRREEVFWKETVRRGNTEAEPEPEPEARVELRPDFARKFAKSFAQLSERDQQVLSLLRAGERGVDIARIVGFRPKQAGMVVKRARERLRDKLAEWLFEMPELVRVVWRA